MFSSLIVAMPDFVKSSTLGNLLYKILADRVIVNYYLYILIRCSKSMCNLLPLCGQRIVCIPVESVAYF